LWLIIQVSRIRKGYEARFRACLQQIRARRVEQGVVWLVGKAQSLSAEEQIPLPEALTRVHDDLGRKLGGHRHDSTPGPIRFFCDAGLGGLARWLRAAGHEAFWEAHIADDSLVREAGKLSATVLTTDSLLMERRALRDRRMPAFWLPPTLPIAEQLAVVFREFNLTVGEPRCMSCGGELRRGDKEALRERIPPRTYRWLDEYFVCSRCDKLFWRGTHWEKISKQLRTVIGEG
jgi:uncharacterized protein with PIN domain